MWSFWRGIVGLGAVFTIVSTAQAQTLQAGSVGVGAFGNAWDISLYEQANAFQADHNFVATSASIWTVFQGIGTPGAYDNGFRGVFNWAIYNDASGAPGTVLASGSVVPVLLPPQIYNGNRSQWSFALPNVAISGNTQYWLGLLNTDSTGSTAPSGLYWSANLSYFDPQAIPPAQGRTPGGAWTEDPATDNAAVGYGNRLTLAVYGTPSTVPEPSSLALLGTGLVGLVPLVRRKSRRS